MIHCSNFHSCDGKAVGKIQSPNIDTFIPYDKRLSPGSKGEWWRGGYTAFYDAMLEYYCDHFI